LARRLEKTPEEFIENCVKWAREVWRVLRTDGCFWLNLGDSYAGGNCGGGSVFDNGRNDGRKTYEADRVRGREATKNRPSISNLKPKDLCGMPWMVAFALQADGWWLRSAMPWVKRCLSGGTIVYAQTRKGEMPMTIKDLVRLKPETLER